MTHSDTYQWITDSYMPQVYSITSKCLFSLFLVLFLSISLALLFDIWNGTLIIIALPSLWISIHYDHLYPKYLNGHLFLFSHAEQNAICVCVCVCVYLYLVLYIHTHCAISSISNSSKLSAIFDELWYGVLHKQFVLPIWLSNCFMLTRHHMLWIYDLFYVSSSCAGESVVLGGKWSITNGGAT